MKSNNSRINRLKEMLALEERRAVLHQELDSLTEKLSALKAGLFSDAAPAPVKAPTEVKITAVKTRTKPTKPTKATTKTVAGSLRDKVIASLEAAGSTGIYVKELASALGTKPVNIHSWFHSNIKRNPAIKKITGGHYKLQGNASSVAPKAKPGPKSKAVKAPKVSKEKVKAVSGSKLGALSASILGALQAAGDSEINVRELADKLGAKYKNIYVWFATTGKNYSQIKKVGPATYKLS